MASRQLIPVLLLLAALGGCTQRAAPPTTETVVIDGHSFDLEIAADEQSRLQGLMERDEIPEHGGMLFIFPDVDLRSFWMAYCDVDMDILFLDPRGRITAMHRMKVAEPQREDETTLEYERRMTDGAYWSGLPAQFAIELQAGWLDRLDLAVDDRIDLDLERLKSYAK